MNGNGCQATQINVFFGDDYVNTTCSFCAMGQAVLVLHDDEHDAMAGMCLSCIRTVRAAYDGLIGPDGRVRHPASW
jgi:hypothetical protein